MDDPIYSSYKIYELIKKNDLAESKLKSLDAKDKATRDAAAKNFEKKCQEEGLEYNVHHDRSIAINELKHESIYCVIVPEL
jgi:hypothetical protein